MLNHPRRGTREGSGDQNFPQSEKQVFKVTNPGTHVPWQPPLPLQEAPDPASDEGESARAWSLTYVGKEPGKLNTSESALKPDRVKERKPTVDDARWEPAAWFTDGYLCTYGVLCPSSKVTTAQTPPGLIRAP